MMGLMLGASSLYAQPGSVQKLAKSVFTLTTFNQKGDIIASTQGVFIDNKGTAISTFKPFVGAVKASVVDASGNRFLLRPSWEPTNSTMWLNSASTPLQLLPLLQPRNRLLATRSGWFHILSRSRLTSRRTSAA